MQALESPREVFLDACGQCARSLAPLGFKYAKSRRRAFRTLGDFDCAIMFQSSHYNVAEHSIALWIHALVSSKRLAMWRSAQPRKVRDGDLVGGGQIGNLVSPPRWRDWNLAGPQRSRTIEDATAAIHTIALPFFDRFSDLASFCGLLTREELPGVWIAQAIEFLLCFADRTAADKALRSFFQAHPEWLEGYLDEFRRFSQDGLPVHPRTGHVSELAYATVAFSLTPPNA